LKFRLRIWPSIAVVVDFPLVPVTPMIGTGQRSMNSRISVVIGHAGVACGLKILIGGRDRGRRDDQVR